MKIRIISVAEGELADAIEYYEEKRKGLGLDFLSEFDSTIERIVQHPEAWPRISHNIRRSLLKRYPYAVLFNVDHEIVIIAVMQLNRKPDYRKDRIT